MCQQVSLGAITRPRLLPERLRKPPFRFLFDIAVEVARQTGFGLAELFGELPEKPCAPSAREEKVDFLQRWIAATAAALPSHAEALAEVSATDVVCGVHAERTNFFLQCLAAAAWPAPPLAPDCRETAAPETAEAAAPAGPVPGDAEAAEPEARLPERHTMELPEAPEMVAAREAAEQAAVQKKAAEEEWARIQAAREARGSPAPEEARKDIDFDAALKDLGALQQEFERTANAWNFTPGNAGDSSGDSDEDAPHPLPGQPALGSDDEQERQFASTAMIFHAKERADKVNDELTKAQDLLASIEDALDARDAELQQKKDLEVQRRDAQQAAAEAQVRAEQAVEEQSKLEKAARKAKRKAAKKAEKERLQKEAEEREAEEKRAAMYPVSKTSQLQGARLVSCVGDGANEEEEYEWDGEPEEPEERNDGMDACFTDAILGGEPDCGSVTMQKEDLFEQIKAEMRDTFVSYLCASLPGALLKRYAADQLLGCLQMLLQDLRRSLAAHSLEDVADEEPTSVAEELQHNSPDGWLDYLQSAPSYGLRQRFDVAELVDTFQALAQSCFDRLTDELGPMSRWVREGSLLHVSPTLAPPRVPTPPTPERTASPEAPSRPLTGCQPPKVPPPPESSSTGRSRVPVFDTTIGPAPWEIEGPAPTPAAPTTRMATGARLGSSRVMSSRPLLSR
ncbi:unnamed protein product [Effrenium voratum]|nr:unnamed protein product [Effrenium voratum]